MRILHILDHSAPLHSGYTFRTLSILHEQRTIGWETLHLTGPKQGPGPDEENVEGFHFYRTRPAHTALTRLPLAKQWHVVSCIARRLESIARETQPNILHAHSPSLNGLAALKVGQKLGIPVVYEVRAFWEDAAVDHGTSTQGGPRYRLTRGLETYVLHRADHVTTICEGLRKDIVARGISAKRVTVIPNAVQPTSFQFETPPNEALARELNLSGKVVLGFVGSFYKYEGLDMLLAALAKVHREQPQVVVLLVGGGPEEERLRAFAQELGLNQQVYFVGRVSHSDVANYYSIIDYLIYPRRSKRITELVTPLKPLEAMALGKPVIASDVGGHRELIEDNQTGILFTAESPDALADRILQAIASEIDLERIKRQGRAFVSTQRNWTQSVHRYKDIYQKLANY